MNEGTVKNGVRQLVLTHCKMLSIAEDIFLTQLVHLYPCCTPIDYDTIILYLFTVLYSICTILHKATLMT